MACTCVVGLQWGDEAKGKIVDLLGEDHDAVVRYNGGPNAGHTIVHGDRVFKLSLLPTGVLRPNLKSVIGNGVVVHPQKFLDEANTLAAAGVPVGDNLVLSNHAHVIFPYHVEEDRLNEAGTGTTIGTTGRGIGPCYGDKVGRVCGIRVGELLRADHLRERLQRIVPQKNRLLSGLAGGVTVTAPLDVDAIVEQYTRYGEQLRPFVADTMHLLHRMLKEGKRLLFEGAQGSLLDVDHGSYPYVTSSSSSPAGIWTGTGIPSRRLDRVVGVVKAYTTRVGKGPFPSELDDGTDRLVSTVGRRIRDTGKEYGTVTGRPRRIGWFDAVAARYSAALAGADELAVMLVDVLDAEPEVAICTGYKPKSGGPVTDEFPGDAFALDEMEPVYETWPGWQTPSSAARKPSELPAAARRYADRIGELMDVPVSIVSVGPDRLQTIRMS